MHLRSLELFCSIAQHRSFSRAAVAHGMTQSAASQAILHLEEEVGAQLIDRSKRPLVLTRAGSVYHEGVRRLMGDYRAVEQEVRCLGSQLAGRLTVASIYSVGLSYMPSATKAFSEMHPEVEVRVEYASPSRVLDLASSGEVDLGLVSYPRGTRTVRAVLWQKEPMRLISSPEHPFASRRDVTLSELHQLPMIGFEGGLKVRRGIDQYLAKFGVRPRITMEFDNLDSIIRAIEANHGIGILPEAAVRRETANGSLRVVACSELMLQRPLGIVRRRSRRLSPAAREFAEMLMGKPLEPEPGAALSSDRGDRNGRDVSNSSSVATEPASGFPRPGSTKKTNNAKKRKGPGATGGRGSPSNRRSAAAQ